jgi:hypothetical protein
MRRSNDARSRPPDGSEFECSMLTRRVFRRVLGQISF